MIEELAAAQSARFAAVDPLLPPVSATASGDRIEARTPDGRPVAAVIYRAVHPVTSWEALWASLENIELIPLIGDTGAAGMAALLRAWRGWLDGHSPGADSSCLLTWPSRDVEVGNVLLEHGFSPQTAIAIRPPDRGGTPGAPEVTVRRAGLADLEELVRLELAELRFAAQVGPSVVRDGAAELLAASLERGLRFGSRVWLAEAGGVAVGVANCGWANPVAGTSISGRLPEGRWGYLGTLSVDPPARGRGIGRALTSVAHRELNVAGVRGTFLFYNPANPLSSVFWHRQGYRPLWTTWELRPAGALR